MLNHTRYYHLLSDAEVRALAPIVAHLRDHREEVLSRFFALYLSHFGEDRTLSEPDFRALFGRDLDALSRNLTELDMEGFATDMRALGYELVEHGVPFAEIIASLHLFEESTAQVYRPYAATLPPAEGGINLYATFDKLSHCRLILLASTYFEGHRAVSAERLQSLEREVERLAPAGRRRRFQGLVGHSDGMLRVYEQITTLAGLTGAVLISGEHGTGKELAARALHERGRGAQPFVTVNCAALSPERAEAEIFGGGGHPGLWGAAVDGTLFLDEVSHLSAAAQEHLVRALQQPGAAPRVVASTSEDPERAMSGGLLRRDLGELLSVHRLHIQPLRERSEDVPLLVEHFAELFAQRGLRRIGLVEPRALSALQGFAWPGNVRELRDAVEHALTLGQGEVLHLSDLPLQIAGIPGLPARLAQPMVAAARISPPPAPAKVPTMEEAERDLILRALTATSGNKLQAARMLRISRHRLYDKLRKFSIDGQPQPQA